MIAETGNLNIEPYLRLGVFFGVLAIMMLAEYFFPRRKEQFRARRWPSNLLLVVLNTLAVRLILPGSKLFFTPRKKKYSASIMIARTPKNTLRRR